ncbi:MAG TPA: iron-sulfur cluster assembly scaffold protein, partial [Nevskiaceae bacterium]|nr:iron-sulfur cluster assembly scaffold protein [Nevskiaceae bacterium]
MNNVYGYSAPVWARFENPARAGRLDGAGVVTVQAGTVAAKSLLQVDLRIDRGKVSEARFLAYGCPVTIAVGDWLA